MKFLNRNIIITLCAFCIITQHAFSQAEYTDLVRNYIILNENAAKIKSSKIKNASVVYISGTRIDTLRVTEYDNTGNVLMDYTRRDTSSGKVGEYVSTRYTYLYKEGRLVEKVDISTLIPRKHYIEYDDIGNISKEEVKEQGKTVFEIEYEYDNLSRLIESSEKDVVNKCKIAESYSYDSYNNLAKVSTKDECTGTKGKPVNTTYSYKYDSKSRIIEKQAIYPNAGYKILTYKYGPKGEVLEAYESAGSDSYEKTFYTYEDNSNTMKVEKDENIGELTKKVSGTIENDKLGNRLEEKYYDSNGKLLYSIKYNYEFY